MSDYTLFNGDCLEFMKSMPDKSVDAVVTDPPYGINYDSAVSKKKGGYGWAYYGESNWDSERPSKIVFDEIIRVSRYQIIWGGNYFADMLPASMGWLVWDKGQRNFSLADFEMAWTNIKSAARIIDYPRALSNREERFHPTQKPIQVMQWCFSWLEKYGKNINTIFDPYMGSGSTGVTCMMLNKNFLGCEIENKYIEVAEKRIKQAKAQPSLFASGVAESSQDVEQLSLLGE